MTDSSSFHYSVTSQCSAANVWCETLIIVYHYINLRFQVYCLSAGPSSAPAWFSEVQCNSPNLTISAYL